MELYLYSPIYLHDLDREKFTSTCWAYLQQEIIIIKKVSSKEITNKGA